MSELIVVGGRAGRDGGRRGGRAPGNRLVEQSRGAALLVLGHRGRGAIASTLLGSVGLSCALHAHCPVTIVRPTSAGDDATAPAVASATPAV